MSPVHFDVGVRTYTDWSLLPNGNATMVDTFRLNKPYRTFYFQSIYEKLSTDVYVIFWNGFHVMSQM